MRRWLLALLVDAGCHAVDTDRPADTDRIADTDGTSGVEVAVPEGDFGTPPARIAVFETGPIVDAAADGDGLFVQDGAEIRGYDGAGTGTATWAIDPEFLADGSGAGDGAHSVQGLAVHASGVAVCTEDGWGNTLRVYAVDRAGASRTAAGGGGYFPVDTRCFVDASADGFVAAGDVDIGVGPPPDPSGIANPQVLEMSAADGTSAYTEISGLWREPYDAVAVRSDGDGFAVAASNRPHGSTLSFRGGTSWDAVLPIRPAGLDLAADGWWVSGSDEDAAAIVRIVDGEVVERVVAIGTSRFDDIVARTDGGVVVRDGRRVIGLSAGLEPEWAWTLDEDAFLRRAPDGFLVVAPTGTVELY